MSEKFNRLVSEIQHRLLKYCGLTSVSKISKDGILHLFVGNAIHLGYIAKEIENQEPDKLYINVLEDLSKNWKRFSAPVNTSIQLDAIKEV